MEHNEALWARYRSGDSAALNLLFSESLPFFRAVANEIYAKSRWETSVLGVDADDLVQIGMLHLFLKIDCFSPERGVSFLTFSRTVIRNAITDYLRKEKSFIAAHDRFSHFSQATLQDTEFRSQSSELFIKSPELLYLEKETLQELREACVFLSDREQKYLAYRFGLDDEGKEHTSANTAAHFSLSLSRGKQTERAALELLREKMP